METAAHPGLIQAVTGRDPYVDTAEVFGEWIRRMDFDASILDLRVYFEACREYGRR
jgi:hypothetical protein